MDGCPQTIVYGFDEGVLVSRCRCFPVVGFESRDGLFENCRGPSRFPCIDFIPRLCSALAVQVVWSFFCFVLPFRGAYIRAKSRGDLLVGS